MLVVKDIRRRSVDGMAEVGARVSCCRKAMPTQDAWIRYPEPWLDHLSPTADAWIPAMLLPAMRLRMPLRIEGAVSERMLAATHRYMDIIHRWCRDYRPVPVEADEVRPSLTGGRQAGSFFSAGVDSFYTALVMGADGVPEDHRIRTLIFISGFDIYATDTEGNRQARNNVAAAAAELGMNFLWADTNLRRVTRRLCGWRYYHGSLMAAVGLAAAGNLGRLYIPSTYAIRHHLPHGSHPELDPLWSTESLLFVHHGAEKERMEKVISQVSRSSVALKYLRVCDHGDHGAVNCAHCSSCVKTRVNLALASVLDKCHTLPGPLDYREIRRMKDRGPGTRLFARDNLRTAIACGADPALIEALSYFLRPTTRLMPWQWTSNIRIASQSIRHRLLGGVLEKATWQRWMKE
jgi:hypothetical protein